MSYPYRVTVSSAVTEVASAADQVQIRFSTDRILPEPAMKVILEKVLQDRGWRPVEGQPGTFEKDGPEGERQVFDVEAATVTVSVQASQDVSLSEEVEAVGDTDFDPEMRGRRPTEEDIERLKGRLKDRAGQELERELRGRARAEAERRKAEMERDLADRLAAGKPERDRELELISREVTAEALKQRARTLGQVVDVQEVGTQDGDDYELTITIIEGGPTGNPRTSRNPHVAAPAPGWPDDDLRPGPRRRGGLPAPDAWDRTGRWGGPPRDGRGPQHWRGHDVREFGPDAEEMTRPNPQGPGWCIYQERGGGCSGGGREVEDGLCRFHLENRLRGRRPTSQGVAWRGRPAHMEERRREIEHEQNPASNPADDGPVPPDYVRRERVHHDRDRDDGPWYSPEVHERRLADNPGRREQRGPRVVPVRWADLDGMPCTWIVRGGQFCGRQAVRWHGSATLCAEHGEEADRRDAADRPGGHGSVNPGRRRRR